MSCKEPIEQLITKTVPSTKQHFYRKTLPHLILNRVIRVIIFWSLGDKREGDRKKNWGGEVLGQDYQYMTPQGCGLVRWSRANPVEGFVLSRKYGWHGVVGQLKIQWMVFCLVG